MKLQIKMFDDYENLSEIAKKLPDEITEVASKLGQDFSKEFDRRMKEGVGLYRPWDDE